MALEETGNLATNTIKKNKAQNQLHNWKKRLIDFSRRNQLLYFKPRANLSIEITDSCEEIFSKLILEEETMLLRHKTQEFNTGDFGDNAEAGLDFDEEPPPGMLPGEMEAMPDLLVSDNFPSDVAFFQTNKDEQALSNATGRIRTRARASLNEHGINILYLGMYFIEWYDSINKSMAKSPLLLIPVSLSKKGLNAPSELSAVDDEMIINPTLAYKLKHEYGIQFPEIGDYELETVEDLQKLVNDFRNLIKAQNNWQLSDESTLSLFSFAKLSMYQDLDENEAKILNHPVIRSFSGEQVDNSDIERFVVKADEIDTRIDANQCYQILDADSSQQEAIYAAKAGQSFVLQGPPGTGKSQTISNIIAESLAQNKKILFVSEKKAALDVVINRLKASGLDKYCLELHGSRHKKSDVVNDMRSSLEDIKELAVSSRRYPYIDDINEVKRDIHVSIDELHKIRQPINRTLYEIYGDLADLGDVGDLNFTIASIERLSEKDLSELDYLFTQLETKSEILNDFPNFIWRNAAPNKMSFELENEIKGNFAEFQTVLTKLKEFANPIAKEYFNREVNTVREFKWLADACKLAVESPFPKHEWFDDKKLEEVKHIAVEAKAEVSQTESAKKTLLTKYSESFMMLNHNDLLTKFTTEYVGVFKFLNVGYWKSMAQIKKTTLFNDVQNLSTMVNDLADAIKLGEQNQKLEGKESEYQLTLGDFYNKFDTNWEETLTAIQWVQKILNRLGQDSISNSLLTVITDSADNDDFEQFKSKADQLILAWELVKFQLEFFKSIFPQDNIDIENIGFEEVNNYLEDYISNVHKLEDWVEFKDLSRKAVSKGLKPFIEALLHHPSPSNSSDIKRKFQKKFYQLWVDKIELESVGMRSFSGEQQQLLVDRFNDLDKKQLAKVNIELSKRMAMNWIEYASAGPNQEAITILNAELNKKRRHKPIRMLVKEIPDLLLTMKPCWMMSPLTVSQLIDQNSIDFDIVIFDEASQIRTEDAIPAIYRGKQLVLAGDTHQLPPTNFFNLSLDDDEEYDEDAIQYDSVLDEAAVFLKDRTLNWHYRSRHESLISFSNRYIYENNLVTFPSPISDNDAFGVHFELVEKGCYERGARFNRNEAKRVAEAILEHYQRSPDKSLGVIAFSEAQQMAIERELEKHLRKNPEMNEFFLEDKIDACFIKNLENVQGDERDVIFFSIGYARDKKGVLSHNFGPLNKVGGHRRLNVAVTRARNKLKVFSSISAGDIDLGRTSAKGAALLKQYLAYVQSGGQISDENFFIDEMTYQGKLTSLEESIAKAIEEEGYKVKRYLGTSNYRIDLAVYTGDDPAESQHEENSHHEEGSDAMIQEAGMDCLTNDSEDSHDDFTGADNDSHHEANAGVIQEEKIDDIPVKEAQQYLLAIETDGYMYQSAATTRDRERLRKQVLESLGWDVHRVYARDWIKNQEHEVKKILRKIEKNDKRKINN